MERTIACIRLCLQAWVVCDELGLLEKAGFKTAATESHHGPLNRMSQKVSILKTCHYHSRSTSAI